jgi:site-specific DNA-methyltransferase (adenine-specific)
VAVLLKPYETVKVGPKTSYFYQADCLEVFRQLQECSIDVIVTSPPYNLGIQYNQYQDTLSRTAYLDWTDRWVAEAARVLRADG